MENHQLNSIKNFIADLHEVFGSNDKDLQLYHRLLNKCQPKHHEQVSRFINGICEFCKENTDAIKQRDINLLKVDEICYNSAAPNNKLTLKVNVGDILRNKADNDSKKSIWSHLQAIYVNNFDDSDALVAFKKSLKDDTPENQLLSTIMSQVESTLQSNNGNVDPLNCALTMMSNGSIQNIIGSLQQNMSEGNFDIDKLFESLKGVMSKIQTQSASQDNSNSKE